MPTIPSFMASLEMNFGTFWAQKIDLAKISLAKPSAP
jgi:hypothetical protein